jgi:hypothetical protein
MEEITHKICSSCNKRLPLKEFPIKPTTRRYDNKCWECFWEAAKPKQTPKTYGKSNIPPRLGKMHDYKPKTSRNIAVKTRTEDEIKEFKEERKQEKKKKQEKIRKRKKAEDHRKKRKIIPGMKYCTKCKEYKPREEFGKIANNPDRKDYYCKKCRRSQMYKKEDVDKVFKIVEKDLKKYGKATAKTLKENLPLKYHSRIYNFMNILIRKGVIGKVKIKNINYYFLKEAEEDNLIKKVEKNKREVKELAEKGEKKTSEEVFKEVVENGSKSELTIGVEVRNENNLYHRQVKCKQDFKKVMIEVMKLIDVVEKY